MLENCLLPKEIEGELLMVQEVEHGSSMGLFSGAYSFQRLLQTLMILQH
jgi:hypothetical protein